MCAVSACRQRCTSRHSQQHSFAHMRVRSEHTITHKVEKAAPAADGKLGFEGDAQTQAKEAKIGTIQGDLAVWEEAKKALPVGPQDAQVLCHNCLQPSFRVCVHVCCMFSLSLSLSLYLSLSLSISLYLSLSLFLSLSLSLLLSFSFSFSLFLFLFLSLSLSLARSFLSCLSFFLLFPSLRICVQRCTRRCGSLGTFARRSTPRQVDVQVRATVDAEVETSVKLITHTCASGCGNLVSHTCTLASRAAVHARISPKWF